MFVRLTFLKISPERTQDVKTIYTREIIPVVKKQKGNLGVRLLEPTKSTDDFISLTEWDSASDADLYESSGVYRELVNLLKDAYLSKPDLKTYHVVEARVAASL